MSTEITFLGRAEITFLGRENGVDSISVPVIGWQAPGPGQRAATDEEFAEYEAYWNGACSVCGKERGDCQMDHGSVTE